MKAQPLEVFLPDTRAVTISPYGYGNLKLGFGVFTYSRPAGEKGGTCPGATAECEAICYAKRITGPVHDVHLRNVGALVPPIPEDCQALRIHVSGDFDTPAYIMNWVSRLQARPEVAAWAYTRSWRCDDLLPYLEQLRSLPNMQLFASMDPSTDELPPTGWRRAWLWRDHMNGQWSFEHRLLNWSRMPDGGKFLSTLRRLDSRNQITQDGTPSYVCPEETGHKADCVSCGYCFDGRRHDVTFLEHGAPA